MATGDATHVDAVRGFNRFWTTKIGLLNTGLLDTPYSLTEARVIFELAQQPSVDLVELRRTLDLDSGYLSRILGRFKAEGLVASEISAGDCRRHVVRLTVPGRGVFDDLNTRSADLIAGLLARLSTENRRRLVTAMATIQDVFTDVPAALSYLIRPLGAGDLGWVVYRHGVVYAEEYGWDLTFEALVARIVADYVEHHGGRRQNAWMAEVDGQAVGCVFVVGQDDETAQLRLLLVEAEARGLGIGRRLVDESVRFAKQAGYRRLVLWTNDVLVSARRIYQAAGFRLVDEDAHHSFGHDLIGQSFELDLDGGTSTPAPLDRARRSPARP